MLSVWWSWCQALAAPAGPDSDLGASVGIKVANGSRLLSGSTGLPWRNSIFARFSRERRGLHRAPAGSTPSFVWCGWRVLGNLMILQAHVALRHSSQSRLSPAILLDHHGTDFPYVGPLTHTTSTDPRLGEVHHRAELTLSGRIRPRTVRLPERGTEWYSRSRQTYRLTRLRRMSI